MNRFTAWLPEHVDGRIRVFAWLSFLAQTTIIATGGAVRLSGSGLGCPTWPTCTADSLVPTDELTYHSLIEFGNRLMTGVVGILAAIVVVLLWRLRANRRDLWTLALVVLGGIVAQAIVGGITVWTGLNPFIVGFHYVSSLLLVCVTAAFLARLDTVPGPRERAVPGWYAGLTHATSAVLAISIVFGVLTTGAGPHSGDAEAGRNGFEAELLEHVHAWPGYALLALTVVLVVAAWRLKLPTLGWATVLLAIEVVQVLVGLYQARNGLPPVLVGIHMVLAALTAAAMTLVILRLKRPVHADRPLEASAVAG
ncbi:heme A synthase [Agromyces sp. MMS24-K17]|uniref:COX15/CtaA family protein n=1 Tax=Agromyces sp. MMS24-K17 TaxID=3372850 RepID=UPI003754E379